MTNQKVINTHWFGSLSSLPENSIYIGRPGPYGNPYSSKSGKYIRDECVALHRIDLYKSLIEDKTLFQRIKDDMLGKDLACWCKNEKTHISCHGDNYIHILSDEFIDRIYDKNVLTYIVDDLRRALRKLSTKLEKGHF